MISFFTYKGLPVNRPNTAAWQKALARAGIDDFRHTWAIWHVQNETALHALKELGSWADLKMRV